MSVLQTAMARLDAQPDPPAQYRVDRSDPIGLGTPFGEEIEVWLRDRVDFLMAARRLALTDARGGVRRAYLAIAEDWTRVLRVPLRIRNAARRRVRC